MSCRNPGLFAECTVLLPMLSVYELLQRETQAKVIHDSQKNVKLNVWVFFNVKELILMYFTVFNCIRMKYWKIEEKKIHKNSIMTALGSNKHYLLASIILEKIYNVFETQLFELVYYVKNTTIRTPSCKHQTWSHLSIVSKLHSRLNFYT